MLKTWHGGYGDFEIEGEGDISFSVDRILVVLFTLTSKTNKRKSMS